MQIKLQGLDTLSNIASLSARIFFREPDALLFKDIGSRLASVREWVENRKQPELLKGIQLLDDFLKQFKSSVSDIGFLEHLAVEYATLFYGIGQIPVDVYESLWLGEEHTLYEKPFFEVVEIYRQWGYKKPETSTEPEDHIANELDFLAYQLKAAISTQNQSSHLDQDRIDSVQEFLSLHLGRWAPDFCDRMLEATDNTYYLAAAYLTVGLIKALASTLELLEDGISST